MRTMRQLTKAHGDVCLVDAALIGVREAVRNLRTIFSWYQSEPSPTGSIPLMT